MSLRRRHEVRSFCRHRSVKAVCFLFILAFVMLYMRGGNGSQDSESHVPFTAKSVQRDERAAGKYELPGAQDPQTIFRDGKLGNYEPKTPEVPGSQPGEGGKPVIISDRAGEEAKRRAIAEYGFNTYVSDMISMNRTIPDLRVEECKHWDYPLELPTVSVVIVFHNEGWTPLLRTLHSVLLRSPSHLLKEIVMVDDDSDKEHLKEKLEKYVSKLDKRIRVVRTEEREGLIRARTFGAKHATADVVVFLDAHCEVNTNWLPPLLAPIKRNRRVMTVPVIDGIEANTWEYRSVYGSARHYSGIFEWGLLYKETEITARELNGRTKDSMPFRSPTHAGGLFAIDRLWFAELGFYDDGLQIWGGEQYELSFKIWMCGGGILFVPCSHVGHVYRSRMPYSFGKLSGKPVVSTNMMRVIKTWMGDYEKYYFTREPQTRKVDPGDISAQLALKERLQCKNFHWYMENVAYDVLGSYPLLPANKVWGEARNAHTGKCLDRTGGILGPLGAHGCHGQGGNQLLRLNMDGQLAQGEWCLTPHAEGVRANHCIKGTTDGPWTYDEDTQQIKTITRRCLTVSGGDSKVSLDRCDPKNDFQKFTWREIYV